MTVPGDADVMHLPVDAADYAALRAGFRWQVPERFNIGWDVCGRHAQQRERFALYVDGPHGGRTAWTFWDVQCEANRLSNTLAALGITPGDRVAIVLGQRPETAIAYVAITQMGAIAVPLSHLFGPDALAFRLADAGVRIAITEDDTLPNVLAARPRAPTVEAIVNTDGPGEAGTLSWEALLARASRDFTAADTRADDPALIIYTSGTTGPPKGALMPHRALIGNLPGFCCSHDFFPQLGDMFWSPADWAWTGGLFDALLPAWHFGMPLLASRARFDPERACWLMERYGIRNAFLFPTALKLIMKEIPQPRGRFDLRLRSLMSGGESVGSTVMDWARAELGVTLNEIFGQTEANYVIGGCARVFAPKPGALGRPYPGHRIALLAEDASEVADGELGEIAVHAPADPVVFLGYWNQPGATRAKYSGAWARTGDLAVRDEDGFYWYRGRTDDVIKSAGYRIGPSEIENCLLQHPAVANAAVIGIPDETRGQIVKAVIVLAGGHAPSDGLETELRTFVRGRLAPYQCPRVFEFAPALPLTTTGKIQRRVLRDNDATPAVPSP